MRKLLLLIPLLVCSCSKSSYEEPAESPTIQYGDSLDLSNRQPSSKLSSTGKYVLLNPSIGYEEVYMGRFSNKTGRHSLFTLRVKGDSTEIPIKHYLTKKEAEAFLKAYPEFK